MFIKRSVTQNSEGNTMDSVTTMRTASLHKHFMIRSGDELGMGGVNYMFMLMFGIPILLRST